MTDKEKKEVYEKIAASGRLNDIQLKKLRDGLNKKPRKPDLAKAKKAWDIQWELEDALGNAPGLEFYVPDSGPDAYNILMRIDIEGPVILSGRAKDVLAKAISKADNIVINPGPVTEITLGFMYVWDSADNIARSSNV